MIYAMGGADPAMGRACWRTRRARRAQCATALTLAILAALVAVGTLEAGWEPATTGAGAARDERAACEGQPATIYNKISVGCFVQRTTRAALSRIFPCLYKLTARAHTGCAETGLSVLPTQLSSNY